MEISLGCIKLKEDIRRKDKRFPFLLKVEKGLKVVISRCERAWSGY